MFHERQQRGDNIVNNEDDSDDDDDELAFRQTRTRNKKYRPEDEVKALLTIYNEPKELDDDDKGINMRKADLVCPPNLMAREKWIRKQSDTRAMIAQLDGDADSWDYHDFNEGIATGWKDDASEKEEEMNDNKMISFKDNKKQEKQFLVIKPKNNSKLLKQTEELEQEMFAEKPWQI